VPASGARAGVHFGGVLTGTSPNAWAATFAKTHVERDYHSAALRVRVLRRAERSPVPACPKGVLQGLQ